MYRFPRSKILVQEEADHNRFSFDQGGIYFVRCYGIALKSDTEEDYYYALGILNSRPVEFYHHLISTPYEGGFFDYRSQFVTPLPFPEASPEDRRAIASVARAATTKYAALASHSAGSEARKDILRDLMELEKELDGLAIALFDIPPRDVARLPPLRYGQSGDGDPDGGEASDS